MRQPGVFINTEKREKLNIIESDNGTFVDSQLGMSLDKVAAAAGECLHDAEIAVLEDEYTEELLNSVKLATSSLELCELVLNMLEDFGYIEFQTDFKESPE